MVNTPPAELETAVRTARTGHSIFASLHPAAPTETNVEPIGTAGMPPDEVMRQCLVEVLEALDASDDDQAAEALEVCFHWILYARGSPEAKLTMRNVGQNYYDPKDFVDVLKKMQVSMRQFTQVDYARLIKIAFDNYDMYVKPNAADCQAKAGDEALCLPGAQWYSGYTAEQQSRARTYANKALKRSMNRRKDVQEASLVGETSSADTVAQV